MVVPILAVPVLVVPVSLRVFRFIFGVHEGVLVIATGSPCCSRLHDLFFATHHPLTKLHELARNVDPLVLLADLAEVPARAGACSC